MYFSLLKALGVFGLSQIIAFVDYLKSKMSKENFDILFHALITFVGVTVVIVGSVLMITGENKY